MKSVTGFSSPEEAAIELDLPLLGTMSSPETTTGAVAASFPHDPESRREFYHAIGRVLQSPLAKHGSVGLVGDVEPSRRAHVASWLAASIAAERTVILIDADLRGAHLSFDERGRAQEGLVDVLRYGVRSPRVVSPTRTAGLNLLPVGSGTLDLAGTFGSGAVPSLFEELKRTGDLIVINGPALGDFQAAAPFLAQVSAWILLHELGASDANKTRTLRATFGRDKCLGIIALRGEPGASQFDSPAGATPRAVGMHDAIAAAPSTAASVLPTPEEIAAWTAETMEEDAAPSPVLEIADTARAAEAPRPPAGPPPLPPREVAPKAATVLPPSPVSPPALAKPAPPDDTLPPEPETSGRAGESKPKPPDDSGDGPPESTSPSPRPERRRTSPVVWVAGIAAVLIGAFFLLRDQLPGVGDMTPLGKRPTATAVVDTDPPVPPPTDRVEEATPDPAVSRPAGDQGSSPGSTANAASAPETTVPPTAAKVDRAAVVGTAGELFYVHVSSLASHGAALVDAARMQRAGFPTGLKRFDLGARGIWWRVYLGPYGERSDADAAAGVAKGSKLTDYTQVYRLEPDAVEVGMGQENR